MYLGLGLYGWRVGVEQWGKGETTSWDLGNGDVRRVRLVCGGNESITLGRALFGAFLCVVVLNVREILEIIGCWGVAWWRCRL